jgi:hypothetical protein
MKKSRWIVVVVAVALAALVVVFFLYKDVFLTGEKVVPNEEPTVVSEEPENTDEGVRKRIDFPPPRKEEAPARLPAGEPGRDVMQERVEQFFASLDGQEYIKAYNLEEGTYQHFLGIASKLSSHPPVVSGETTELSLLKSNMTHFFRVMGKKDISLVLDILAHEEERIEDVMQIIYEWGMREVQCGEGAVEADMDVLYDYAAFFLNTIGGKAYLLRRDSRVRMLLTYYSILVLDRANAERMNRHGVDILPHVDLLIDDLERYEGLAQRDTYLQKLKTIREQTGRHAAGENGGTPKLRVVGE